MGADYLFLSAAMLAIPMSMKYLLAFEIRKLLADLVDGRVVLFHHRQLEQLAIVGEATIEGIDGLDHGFQRRPLLAQLLGIVRVVPDVRAFQLAGDFF